MKFTPISDDTITAITIDVRFDVTRVFICRRDDGTTGTNWAGILGPLAAAGVADSYLPKDSWGVGNVFGNWGFALAI